MTYHNHVVYPCTHINNTYLGPRESGGALVQRELSHHIYLASIKSTCRDLAERVLLLILAFTVPHYTLS